MSPVTYILLSVIAFGALLSFAWRFASRRLTLPCPSWLRWLVELDSPFVRSNRASVIVEHLDLQPGMRVLDIGCGPGRLTIPIDEKVGPKGNVVAIDVQPRMLRRAEEKAQQSGLSNISFREVKMGDGKLDFGQFDRAVLITVLGEIPDLPIQAPKTPAATPRKPDRARTRPTTAVSQARDAVGQKLNRVRKLSVRIG